MFGMYHVTRWAIASALITANGQLTIKDLCELAPSADLSEIIEGIKFYLEEENERNKSF